MAREWKTSLFDCCPIGLCLKGTCCTCILVGQNHARITRNAEPDPPSLNGWCLGWVGLSCCGGFGWVLQMLDGEAMAHKYGMKHNAVGGCCKSFWCGCCEAIQTSKELDYIQFQSRGGGGYVPPGKMQAIPQDVKDEER